MNTTEDLIKKIQELTIENERLKGFLVLMDEKQEQAAPPSKYGLRQYIVSIEDSPLIMDSFQRRAWIYNTLCSKLANAFIEDNSFELRITPSLENPLDSKIKIGLLVWGKMV